MFDDIDENKFAMNWKNIELFEREGVFWIV